MCTEHFIVGYISKIKLPISDICGQGFEAYPRVPLNSNTSDPI